MFLKEIYKKIETNNGWVYIVHAQGTDRYKIGRSKNPVQRLERLKEQSPYPLIIVDSI